MNISQNWLLPVDVNLNFPNCKTQFEIDLDKVHHGVQDNIINNIEGGRQFVDDLITNLIIGAKSCAEYCDRIEQLETELNKLKQRPDLS